MKNILIQIASHALAIAILALLSPYLIYINIKDAYADAYQEEQATSCMHRRIDTFLREQRGEDPDDEYGYHQIHTW